MAISLMMTLCLCDFITTTDTTVTVAFPLAVFCGHTASVCSCSFPQLVAGLAERAQRRRGAGGTRCARVAAQAGRAAGALRGARGAGRRRRCLREHQP